MSLVDQDIKLTIVFYDVSGSGNLIKCFHFNFV